MFPKIGVPPNGWLIMENPIKMDDLRVPLFLETPICCLREIHGEVSFSGFHDHIAGKGEFLWIRCK